MENCIFCKIITGSIPSHKVYEDDYTLAVLDIRPSSHGHTLVLPKDHFENIYTLPDEALARLMLTVKKVSLAVKNSMDADGINISMNNEEAAGQVIFHAHIHVIPRKSNDGLENFPQKSYNDGEADEVAQKIRESFKTV